MYVLANVVAIHAAGAVAVWWLYSPSRPLVNIVGGVTAALTVLWVRLVVVRRARRLASEFENLTPNLITHGPPGGCRWDRRSRRQDEILGAETRAGNSV
jgi:hypothetical protein